MKLTLTGQTVVLLARWALVIRQGRVEGKHCAAARGRAPACILHVLLYVVMEGELLVLFSQVFWKVFVKLILSDLVPAILVRAVERNMLADYLLFRVFG